jgi:hypothetical protein
MAITLSSLSDNVWFFSLTKYIFANNIIIIKSLRFYVYIYLVE